MRFSKKPYTVTDRSAVIFRFALRNFKVKMKDLRDKKSVKLNDKAMTIIWEVKKVEECSVKGLH